MQEDRDRALEFLRRFGANPVAFFVRYDAPWKYFFSSAVPGVACYVEVHRTAVVWGDPLCDPADLGAFLAEFTAAMRSQRLRVCFLALQEATARVALAARHAVLKIGEEPTFDLSAWRGPVGDPGKNLRWCLNHARRAGVTVHEYRRGDEPDDRLESELRDVQAAWEASLGRRIVHSFIRPSPFLEAGEKRFFYATRAGRAQALLACSPVYGRDGWYLEDLIRRPGSVNGTTELVVVEAMRRLRQDGARFATLGIAPLKGSDSQMDRRARILIPALRLGFEHMDSRFHFASLSQYKEKYLPSAWEPRYVAFLPARPSIRLARAAISVLDPEPPKAETTPARRQLGSGLVALQAVLWSLASIVVLAREHLRPTFASRASELAPVGLTGVLVAVLLSVAAYRIARGDALSPRLLAVLLEGVLLLGAIDRLKDHRAVPIELLSVALAAVVLVVLFPREERRPPAQEDVGEADGVRAG